MPFDAVSIEHAFAKLVGSPIGSRGTSHDADTFRGGNVKSLGAALQEATDALEARVKALPPFTAAENQNGAPKARLDVAIGRLKAQAAAMSKSTAAPQREDYHWELIGCLVSTIDALLDSMQRRGV